MSFCRLETAVLTKTLTPNRSGRLTFFFANGLKLRFRIVIAVLIAVLAILYVSAVLMMMRIDRLHTAYLNHPFVSPERFTQDRLLHYLNTNLDQIVKVKYYAACSRTSMIIFGTFPEIIKYKFVSNDREVYLIAVNNRHLYYDFYCFKNNYG